MKKIVLFLLIFTMMVATAISVAGAENYSEWAAEGIKKAGNLGLITTNASNDYQKKLTRLEFCELAVNLYEKSMGVKIDVPASNSFNDTKSDAALKAYSIGIMNGTSPVTFSPNQNVTREQAAAIMINTIRILEKTLGVNVYTKSVNSVPFKDKDLISPWAISYVHDAYANGMMVGDGEHFRPLDSITSQECVMLVLKNYESYANAVNPYAGGGANESRPAQPSAAPNPAQPSAPTNTSAPISKPETITVAITNVPESILTGDKLNLAYEFAGNNGQKPVSVSWTSSSPSVISVDQTGSIMGIKTGSSTISVSASFEGNKTVKTSVKIMVEAVPIALDSVIVDPGLKTVKIGDSVSFKYKLTPSTATISEAAWSSTNTSVAIVDSNGKVALVGPGNTNIKITIKDKSGNARENTASLTVQSAETLTSISFSNVKDVIFVGDQVSLYTSAKPSGVRIVSETWASSDGSVLSVDNKGRVTARAGGSATITYTATDITGKAMSAAATITVKDNYSVTLTVPKAAYDLEIGETLYIEFTVEPATAVVKSVSLSPSPSGIITASSTERSIRGSKEGTAVVTMTVKTDDGSTHSQQLTVTVSSPRLESVEITGTKENFTINSSESAAKTKYRVKINPSKATYGNVDWSSSDTNVATVDSDGNVQAVGTGSCAITVTVTQADGFSLSGTKYITVTSK